MIVDVKWYFMYFEGSSCSDEEGLKRRSFIFHHCMDILNETDISTKVKKNVYLTSNKNNCLS